MKEQVPSREQLVVVEAELGRCLEVLVELFGDREFRAHPPQVVLDPGFPPVPGGRPLEVDSSLITLFTRRDLSRPREEILTLLLHKAIHAFHAFRWQEDCTCWSYHTRRFCLQAQKIGFEVSRVSRYGWAETQPSPRLRRRFADLALSEELLRPFKRDPLLARGLSWDCGRFRFPEREDLARRLVGPRSPDPRRVVQSLCVQRHKSSPMVRLCGRWLRPLGFREGVRMKVEARYGRLRIEARAFEQTSPNLTLHSAHHALQEAVGELARAEHRLGQLAASLPSGPVPVRGLIEGMRELLKGTHDTLGAAGKGELRDLLRVDRRSGS